MSYRSFRVWNAAVFLLPFAVASLAARADQVVYDDELQNGFQNWSWQAGGDAQQDVDLANADPVQSGAASVSYLAHDWNGLSFAHASADFATADFPELRFFVRGGAGGEQLTLTLQLDAGLVASTALAPLVSGGAIAAGEWREVVVAFADPPLSYSGSFDRIDLHDASGIAGHGNAQQVFVDALRLVSMQQLDDAIFLDGFEGAGPANDPPVAVDDAHTIGQGALLDVAAPGVLANDSDANGDALQALLLAGPAYASDFALAADGSFSYTHDGSGNFADSFTYQASDGMALSDPATVSLDITPIVDPPGDARWVSGYYVGYERFDYPIAEVDFSAITHLMVGRLIPNANGTLTTHFDIDAVNGPIWAQAAVDAAQAAGRKAILMVGGAGEIGGWRGAAADANRAAFVANLLAAMDGFGADGLDIDWEPIAAEDHAPLLALVQDLRSARPGMLLTMPVGGINVNFPPLGEAALFQALHPLLDQLNVMSYDMAQAYEGWHSWFASALDGEYANAPMSVSSSVDYYLGLDVPAAKLGVGIGFYGACYHTVTQPRQPAEGFLVASDGAMSYRNIVADYLPNMPRTFDAIADAPWLGNAVTQGPQNCNYVSYEDAQSIAAKGAYVAQAGLGGTIIWTISQGQLPEPADPRNPLLDAVREAFLGDAMPTASLQVERDVTVDSMLSDRFTWIDSAGKPRSAVLAHNNTAAGPNGARGGALRRYDYQLPNGSTRSAGPTTYGNAGHGGFGYVVAHSSAQFNGGACIGDDSPLGFKLAGTFERVWEGRHHAIFRFRQNYPRNCAIPAPAASLPLPTTIDWVFATGRDHPLWSITYDMAVPGMEIPVNTLFDDSRAPYGELNIDGVGAANISGVAWGDRWKFTSTSAPLSLNSAWTWNQPNTVPYIKLWIASSDATMGTVQTQTMSQQDAGARNEFYHDITAFWGQTSADGNAGDAYVMPWNDSWPYQSLAFSLNSGAPNANTNNARLTWGTSYGFLGRSTYSVYDGVVAQAPGHPRKSYGMFVILDTHTRQPVETQVEQIETLQQLTLTADLGSVALTGPAGVADTTPKSYDPSGYDHVRAALTFIASANRLDANIALADGTLSNPLIVLRGYSAAQLPVSVRLGETLLVSDVDYFASVRDDADELWLTLKRDLNGAVNRLRIDP